MTNTTQSQAPLVILSAGGTGGHMSPAAALAADLITRGYRVMVVTDARGMKYAAMFGDIKMIPVASAAMTGGIAGKIKNLIALAHGFFEAATIIRRKKPSVILGFGGYPSVPAVYAGQWMGIPTVIHEQNAVLGKANVFLARRAQKIALSWPVSNAMPAHTARTVVTGNPVRSDIAALSLQPYPGMVHDATFRILVMGGSLGAKIFSDTVPAALVRLPPEYRARLQIIQQCRADDIDRVRVAYQTVGIKADLRVFINDMAAVLGQSHLVICRSGASTVAELAAAGRPAIFVPYPHHADQQQTKNAGFLVDAGGAWIMPENGFTPDALAPRIETFLQNSAVLSRAAENAREIGRADAARRLGDIVRDCLNLV